MQEVNTKPLQAWVKLMLLTSIVFIVMLLMVRYKFNGPDNLFWPFIRFASKWSIFSWMIYGGRIYERHLSKKVTFALEEKIKDQEELLKSSNDEIELQKLKVVELSRAHESTLTKVKATNEELLLKLKRHERSASDANQSALRSFL